MSIDFPHPQYRPIFIRLGGHQGTEWLYEVCKTKKGGEAKYPKCH
jgi:hypothetical protein